MAMAERLPLRTIPARLERWLAASRLCTVPYREDPADALSDLTDEEAHAFAVLVRTVARADGGVTDAERAHLASFAAEMGEERFWPLVERTRGATGKAAVEQAVTARRFQESLLEAGLVQNHLYP